MPTEAAIHCNSSYSEELRQLLASLNDYQIAAVNAGAGLYSLIGVPGSGKTRAIVARIARLAADGLDPNYILAMTFTRNAAFEMNERLRRLGIDGARVGTIHSVCRQIVASETKLFETYQLDERGRLNLELKKLLGDLRKDGKIPRQGVDREGVGRYIEACKARGLCYVFGDPFGANIRAEGIVAQEARRWNSMTGLTPRELQIVYCEMEKRRASRGLFDFDDMLLWCWMQLVVSPESRLRWRQRWSVVIVDECFDGRSPVLLADGSTRPIKDLVGSRYAGRVLSYDQERGCTVSKRVTGWHKVLLVKKMVRVRLRQRAYDKNGKRWSASTEGVRFGFRHLVCTEDQLVLKGFGRTANMVPAAALRPGDVVTMESSAPRITTYAQAVGKSVAGRRRLAADARKKHKQGKIGVSHRSYGTIKAKHRGGNGRGPSPTELAVAAKLGPEWVCGHTVTTGFLPHHYKIDVAHPGLKVAVELDGCTHYGGKRRAADRRKDNRLHELGWTVVRLRNREALGMSACEIGALAGLPDNCPVEAEVLSVEPWRPCEAYVYDIDVEDTHVLFVDGIAVHNCQDSNPVQWDMARLLVGLDSCVASALDLPEPPERDEGLHNLMVGGDSSQSIYGWRSAEPELFVEFASSSEVQQLVLPINYRSNTSICRVGTGLVRGKPWHLAGEIRAHRLEPAPGAVSVVHYQTPEEEAAGTVRRCMELAQCGGFRSCAVLSRLSVGLNIAEIECIRNRVPYVKRASGSFFESQEIKDILAYLRVAAGFDPDGRWLRHIINRPFRYIGSAFISESEAHSQQSGVSLIDAMLDLGDHLTYKQLGSIRQLYLLLQSLNKVALKSEEMSEGLADGEDEPNLTAGPAKMIAMVLDDTDYIEEIRREEGLLSMDESKIVALSELQRMAGLFKKVSDFLAYIDTLIVAVRKARSNLRVNDESSEDALVLSTIHRAKGLEWDHVFLIDVAAGRFPHVKSQNPDEELRLLYVAETRARESCVISYSGEDSARSDEDDDDEGAHFSSRFSWSRRRIKAKSPFIDLIRQQIAAAVEAQSE